MTTIAVLAALIANGITQYVKPSDRGLLTEEQLTARKYAIRIINAGIGLTMLIVGAVFLGEDLPADQVTTYIEIIAGGLVTFFTSQQVYQYTKSR